MGGLGPGIGGLEILVIGLLALIVVGPKDLPVLMRKVGQAMAKARAMANDFRASFDEMARQSELDELRKEVDALRRNQMMPLGAEAEATFRDINADLNRPVEAPAPLAQPLLTGPEEFAEPQGPAAAPDARPVKARKPRSVKSESPAKPSAKTAAKTSAKAPARAGAAPRPARKKAAEQ
jgi:sec-independent protein translocase protein TatB